MKIKPDKPLPSELSKEWEETFAKLLLEHYFPSTFRDLKVDNESPDLRNKKLRIGVEVTNNENSISREIDSLYCRKYTCCSEKLREEARKRISELGGRIGPYFLSHPTMSRDLSRLYKRVEDKTKKLNKNYDVFDNNYLFVFDIGIFLDEELPRILEELKVSSVGEKYSFCGIFIYCFGGDLYAFDLINDSFQSIHDNNNTPQELSIKARKMLEEKYNN